MNIRETVTDAERACFDAFSRIDAVELHNTGRVLELFQTHQVAAHHFSQTTGYGLWRYRPRYARENLC